MNPNAGRIAGKGEMALDFVRKGVVLIGGQINRCRSSHGRACKALTTHSPLVSSDARDVLCHMLDEGSCRSAMACSQPADLLTDSGIPGPHCPSAKPLWWWPSAIIRLRF